MADTPSDKPADHSCKPFSELLAQRPLLPLALGNWIESGHSVLITGLTGAGKTWLACALAQYACRRGHTALYQRVPRLGEELRIRHGNGTFGSG